MRTLRPLVIALVLCLPVSLFAAAPLTGEALRAHLRSGGSGVSEDYLDAIEEAAKHDSAPDDPWA